MNNTKHIFSVMGVMILAGSVVAGSQPARAQTIQSGPAVGEVWSQFTNGNDSQRLTRDGDTLWVATGGGLVKWNLVSMTWEKFTTASGLPDNDLNDVLVDGSGALWIATESAGAARYNGSTWTIYDSSSGLATNTVYDIEQDGDTLWFGTSSGLKKFSGGAWTNYTMDCTGFNTGQVREIAVAADHSIWTAAGGYVYHMVDGAYCPPIGSGLSSFLVTIALDTDGTPWVGTSGNGVFHRTPGGTWENFTTANGLTNNWVNDIAVDSVGDKLFTTNANVTRLHGSTWSTVSTNGQGATGIALGPGDEIWLGIWNNGVVRYVGAEKTWIYLTGQSPRYNDVHGVFPVSDGRVLVADGSILQEYAGATSSWPSYPSVPGGVFDMDESPDGSLWFATGQGLAHMPESGPVEVLTTANGMPDNWISNVDVVAADDIWVGTYLAGAAHFDGSGWTSFREADGLADDFVSDISVAPDHAVWFCTGSGLSKFAEGAWTTYTTANGLAFNSCSSLHINASGVVYAGTPGGVSRLSGGTWTTLVAPGATSTGVVDVIEDQNGNLWAAVSRYLWKFDGVSWTIYTTADGIPTNSIRTVAEDNHGGIWIGTLGGLTIIDQASHVVLLPMILRP